MEGLDAVRRDPEGGRRRFGIRCTARRSGESRLVGGTLPADVPGRLRVANAGSGSSPARLPERRFLGGSPTPIRRRDSGVTEQRLRFDPEAHALRRRFNDGGPGRLRSGQCQRRKKHTAASRER